MTKSKTIFTWLEANGYTDVAETINTQKKKWAEQGSKTRRNWWEVLSGGKDGKPNVIAGIEFPVLAAAQKRQGKPVTDNAVSRADEKEAPGIKTNTRWSKKETLPSSEKTTVETDQETAAPTEKPAATE